MLKQTTKDCIAASRVHRAGHLTPSQRKELASIFRMNRQIGNPPYCRWSSVLGYFVWSIGPGLRPLRIGDRVRVAKEINRRSRIVSIHSNDFGTKIHVLADGGFFSRIELEPTI